MNFGSWSRNIAVIGLSKDKMIRMFVFSEKSTTDHQNSNNPLEHTRGYPQIQILKGFPSSNQVVEGPFGMSTQGFLLENSESSESHTSLSI